MKSGCSSVRRFVMVLAFAWCSAACSRGTPLSPLAEANEVPTVTTDTVELLTTSRVDDHDGARTVLARTDPDTSRKDAERDGSRVPPFHLIDSTGDDLRSEDLVGKQAFAVVFFASWCELCARKLKMVRDTFEAQGDVHLLLVSVDGPDTVHHVPGFLREQRLEQEQVIDGLNHPRFTHGYNPVSSIPLVAVVGRSGNLIDYQIGLQQGDAPRLRTALVRATQ